MLGFPTPYPNELLYSVIARAGQHEGITSPKQLLDSVFSNRKVIATVDLPGHIEKIANQYPQVLGLQVENLIRKHTLWPVYAPFVPVDRRKRIESWMSGESKGAVHLAAGIVASRVNTKQSMFLCESCKHSQELKYGEVFWDRRWQVPLVSCCPEHGSLSETSNSLNGMHRHEFVSLSQCEIISRPDITISDIRFSKLVYELFDWFITNSPSYDQWTQFYRNLAIDHGYLHGRRIDHERLYDQYVSYWDEEWLKNTNLLPACRDTSWLKSIFRKHRKSFSFAEHLSAIGAISQGKTQIGKMINKAVDYQSIKKESTAKYSGEPKEINEDQKIWLSLLVVWGPKSARKIEPALYTRLYRNYYHWLMNVDKQYRLRTIKVNNRVAWSNRDREAARELVSFIEQVEEDLYMPRLTRTFLIHQLNNSVSIEKNLYRLPRCSAILTRYSESIDEYQVRRLTRAYIALGGHNHLIKRWILLRRAGLSEVRMTCIVKDCLKEIVKNDT